MKFIKNITALFMLSSIFSVGCKHTIMEIPMPVDTSGLLKISYLNDIKPIITTYCLGMGNQQCHVTNTNQGANGNFTTYSGLKLKVDNGSLAARVLNPAGGMPPSYTLGPMPVSDSEKTKIQTWISQGALNN